MALLSPGLTALIFGLAESNGPDGFAATKAWLPIAAGALLIAGFLRHGLRAEKPLIDIRTFTRTRAGAAAGTFLLFAIAFFGSLLLIPLYYQTVRGASALEAGLLLAPQGLGAMITMPLAGRLTDRYGPGPWPACGIPLLAIGIAPFAFVSADTSYVLLCGFGFILGLGMGLAMMPTMTAAMQAVPQAAIARTSTAMNIIRQSGASIGTAILSVLLASAVTDRLVAAGHPAGTTGLQASQSLSPAQQSAVAEPLAEAFAQTFVWGLALLALAFIPALAMALGRRKAPTGERRAREERTVVFE
jgi:MFS family permease